MFFGWQTFYQLTGSAAGALIGLLFIVATLTSRQNQTSLGGEGVVGMGVQLFTTPTVFHLGVVLIVSALALAPGAEIYSASLVMLVCALFALGYMAVIAVRLSRLDNPTHWSDFWCYGAAPVAVYLALAAAAGAAWLRAPHAAYAVGLTLLVLLMVAIRNAWDLVTWLSARRTD
jgi:hypothetical protein